jgi:hypothetical protein
VGRNGLGRPIGWLSALKLKFSHCSVEPRSGFWVVGASNSSGPKSPDDILSVRDCSSRWQNCAQRVRCHGLLDPGLGGGMNVDITFPSQSSAKAVYS